MIVVTGAAGFIGARFVEACNRRGVRIVSVDDPAAFDARPEHRGLEFGEIVSPEEIGDHLANAGEAPEAIVHLGACTDTTELDVAFLTRVNLEASKELWNYAAERGSIFVYASSAATYGGGEQGYVDDPDGFDSLIPLNPYGDSKLQFDLWARAEAAAGRRPKAWSGFKFFNVYGFGERHKQRMASVVLQAFDQIRATGSVKLFRSHREGIADGEQKRDFIYVQDVVDVLWFAIEKPIESGVFNLGTGRARTFLDLVRAVFAALGVEENVVFVDTPEDIRERYQYFTEADMARLRETGYDRPFTSLEDGVQAYVERLLAQ